VAERPALRSRLVVPMTAFPIPRISLLAAACRIGIRFAVSFGLNLGLAATSVQPVSLGRSPRRAMGGSW
jgi:hypothetical protein